MIIKKLNVESKSRSLGNLSAGEGVSSDICAYKQGDLEAGGQEGAEFGLTACLVPLAESQMFGRGPRHYGLRFGLWSHGDYMSTGKQQPRVQLKSSLRSLAVNRLPV